MPSMMYNHPLVTYGSSSNLAQILDKKVGEHVYDDTSEQNVYLGINL